MDINLRHAVIHNVTGKNQDQLEETIVDAIQRQEEKMLPGLGVLFEIIWQGTPENERKEIVQLLESGLNK
ncbi:small acid-soluble spore protein I (minor) [Peribacillus deserti]|uniref:Small, acid-soluble spore protein I n=1 Tax=Peribacillus deserti TaxID=673318 RepID=A0ABS2QI55_9BACI|nr:small acid-soluble spore protein SspI [Peribacillus deserti]MBM7692841.1 small acid-soluble spore protein I (minor) [Peribacillus deserti]